MLTYQQQSRILHTDSGRPIDLPNHVRLEIEFAPPTAFGSDDAPSRTLVREHAASLALNANTGRWQGQSSPPLEAIEVIIESPTSRLELSGGNLTYDFECEDAAEFNGTLQAFRWVIPPLLNLEFSDPPTVTFVRGVVGDVPFRWEHSPEEWQIQIRPVTADELERHFATAIESLSLFNGTDNRRYAAALAYFHTAVRLAVAGDSPWEFMAETILNYSKCIEILFVTSENSKDDVRAGLAALGYSSEEIEGDFIPLLIVRSYVDVAHPQVAIQQREDLQVLYKYMAAAEDRIRQMLKRVLTDVGRGGTALAPDGDLSLSRDQQKGMKRLIATMKSRLGPSLAMQ